MTPDTILKIGWAFGTAIKKAGIKERNRILIGKDTRVSGYIFESALEAGIASAGVNVGLLGPLPTPAIASLVPELNALGAICISASHNPHYDNGLKFFNTQGDKISDSQEQAIESLLTAPLEMVDAADLGKASRVVDAAKRYEQICIDKFTGSDTLPLKGMRLVVDCAHGATYHVAPNVYRALGAEVVTIGADPDGFNINKDVGTLHPDGIKEATLAGNFDYGIAFDGDGDRLFIMDAQGRLLDGDDLLFVMADYLQRHNLLQGGVVGTQMSNYGLEEALRASDIPFKRAAVGDRYVLEMLRDSQWQIGGESSGHIFNLGKSNFCDAIINSLAVLEIVCKDSQKLNHTLQKMNRYHQTLVNIRLHKDMDYENTTFKAAVEDAQNALNGKGRLLIRLSGTEPLLRIMVETKKRDESQHWANHIGEIARKLFGK